MPSELNPVVVSPVAVSAAELQSVILGPQSSGGGGGGSPALATPWRRYVASSYLGVVADQGAITTPWEDQSPNGVDATGPTSMVFDEVDPFFNNKPSVFSTNGRYTGNLGAASGRAFTAIVVGRMTAGTISSFWLAANSNTWSFALDTNNVNSLRFTWDWGPAASALIELSPDESIPWIAVIEQLDPSGGTLTVNGVELVNIGAAVADQIASITIGRATNGLKHGRCAEIVMFDGVLDPAELAAWVSFLQTEYAITF